jgi:hypothetical protein
MSTMRQRKVIVRLDLVVVGATGVAVSDVLAVFVAIVLLTFFGINAEV